MTATNRKDCGKVSLRAPQPRLQNRYVELAANSVERLLDGHVPPGYSLKSLGWLASEEHPPWLPADTNDLSVVWSVIVVLLHQAH